MTNVTELIVRLLESPTMAECQEAASYLADYKSDLTLARGEQNIMLAQLVKFARDYSRVVSERNALVQELNTVRLQWQQELAAADARTTKAEAERNELRNTLGELFALVHGECPSLLNEDSGGDSRLDMTVRKILEAGQ